MIQNLVEPAFTEFFEINPLYARVLMCIRI